MDEETRNSEFLKYEGILKIINSTPNLINLETTIQRWL